MKFDRLKDSLKSAAPSLAAALATGASGPLVGAAVHTLAKSFLNKDSAEPREIEAAILDAGSVGKEKLKELDNHFKLEMEKLSVQLVELAGANTANARAMQVAALQQDDKFSKRFPYVLAAGWSCFACIFFTAITFIPIGQENMRFADTVLGALLTVVVASIINYFYGSSVGSKSKEAELKSMK